jgi:hypothetical protein
VPSLLFLNHFVDLLLENLASELLYFGNAVVGGVEHRLAFGRFERVSGIEFGQLEFVLFVADCVLGQAPPLERRRVFSLLLVFLALLFGRLNPNIFLLLHHLVILLHDTIVHGTGPLQIKVNVFIETRECVLNVH